MKKFILSLILCLASCAYIVAQSVADIMISYDYQYPNFKTGQRSNCDQYLLLANASCSKFYSAQTEYIDSLRSTPEGLATLNEMRMAAFNNGKIDEAPIPKATIYVTKNQTARSMTVYDVIGMEMLCYDEPTGGVAWEIADSTKTVLDYDCQMATADYHGRQWTAWFTPEIPLQEGPWKLSGLPGLILEASTDDGLYLFTATGMQQTDKTIGPVYLAGDCEKVTRENFWTAKRQFTDNPLGNVNAQLASVGMSITPTGASKKRNNLSRAELDFIETDY